jgi:sodium transport system permease protein
VSHAPNSFITYYNSVKDDYNMNVNFGTFNQDSLVPDIRDGQVDLLIEFEEGFDAKVVSYMENESVPEVFTYSNPSEEYSMEAKNNFVYGLLEGYEKIILTNRFGNINYVKAFDVDRTNQKSEILDEKKAAASGLGMIVPMLLAVILFAGAMGIGMDTIAGEKERGTMATLLLTPVKRETIALGKVIGLGIVAIISAACSFGAIIASLPNMLTSFNSSGDMAPIGLSFNIAQYVQLFIIMITLVGIYVGLICFISVRARSVKEAGTYMAPVYMIIMVSAFSTMFAKSGEVVLYKFAIPVYGSVYAIKEMFAFELSLDEFGVAIAVSLAVTALLVKLITKTFNNEKIMFNA